MQANDMSKAIETLTLQILVLDLHNFDALKKGKSFTTYVFFFQGPNLFQRNSPMDGLKYSYDFHWDVRRGTLVVKLSQLGKHARMSMTSIKKATKNIHSIRFSDKMISTEK